MTMVAQKIKISLEREKQTVCGSALVTLGHTTLVNFCTCLLCLSLLRINFFQFDMIFSIAFILIN